MKTININGHIVRVSVATVQKFKKIAREKKISLASAVFLRLKKVI